MSNAVIVKNLAGKLIIQFNRPKIRSPLSIFVLEELRETLDGARGNPAIEMIIFTGRDNVFASGADLREIASVTKETAREFALRGQNLMNFRCRKAMRCMECGFCPKRARCFSA
jgi:enoyl-CoA hydratase/carnithine racemase